MKSIKISHLIILFFFLVDVPFSFGQVALKSVSVVVKADHNQQGIDNVEVLLENKFNNQKTTGKTNSDGKYVFSQLAYGEYQMTLTKAGYVSKEEKITVNKNSKNTYLLTLKAIPTPEAVMDVEYDELVDFDRNEARFATRQPREKFNSFVSGDAYLNPVPHNTESYNAIEENGYQLAQTSPLSTFSVDVDAASYANIRRFIRGGQWPALGSVRIEEMINYFNYDYPDPKGDQPFSITTEVGDCPWNQNKIVHIGLQGKRMENKELPSSNLVFLLDVSGSMNQANKLPLLKKSFTMLINELGENDRIAIVVYAGAAGVVLPSTSASEKQTILNALNKLEAGGSTAGGQGIELAYKVAQENFIKGGNNRVILATDGDFNIGMSSDAAMQKLIEEKRTTGVFLTCLGFGTGNFQDSKMEILADKGNGNYAYIDNVLEAKKVLVTEIGATLLTIAKDVKIQVEFNPALVHSYRLIGYENRMLNTEDFNDDKKDAGEIGAGHSVTALYEVVLKGEEKETSPNVDPLRYGSNTSDAKHIDELLTVKFRYKEPNQDISKLIEKQLLNTQVPWGKLSNNYRFSIAVAGFGMLLRNSEFKGDLVYDKIIEMAKSAKGEDLEGYRSEFIQLVESAKLIKE